MSSRWISMVLLAFCLGGVVTGAAHATVVTPGEGASVERFADAGKDVTGEPREKAVTTARAQPRVQAVLEVHPGEERMYVRWTATGSVLVYWRDTDGRLILTVDVDTTTNEILEISGLATNIFPGANAFEDSWLNHPAFWIALTAGLAIALFPVQRPSRHQAGDLAALALLHACAGAYFLFAPREWAYPGSILLIFVVAFAAMLWLAYRCLRSARGSGAQLATLGGTRFPVWAIASACLVLSVMRSAALIIEPVIFDVSLASVSGAQFLQEFGAVYGRLEDSAVVTDGDTYGPWVYVMYSLFLSAGESLDPVSQFRVVPAAASLVGDLATTIILYFAGRRWGGPRAGWTAALLWLSLAPTSIALISSSNDWVVSVPMALTALWVQKPGARGAALAFAAWAKFAPMAAALALARHRDERWNRQTLRYVAGLFLVSGLSFAIAVHQPDGVARFVEATFGSQADRDPVNSIPGMLGWPDWIFTVLAAVAVVATVAPFLTKRVPGAIGTLACATYAIIVVQLAIRAWWFTYILWFLPTLLIVWTCREPERELTERPNDS
jgi:hypothetical protein